MTNPNIKFGEAKAIFLDRDGTLNKDVHYLSKLEDFYWIEGVLPALKQLYDEGYMLVVVSNQSGIAQKLLDEPFVHQVNEHMQEAAKGWGFKFEGFYHCPHHPRYTGICSCRKPSEGMWLQASAEIGIDLNKSWSIGDKPRDLIAGISAGTRVLGVKSPDAYTEESSEDLDEFGEEFECYNSIAECVSHILNKTKSS